VTEGEEAQRGGKQANIIKADVSVKAGAKVSVTATRRLWQARYKYLLDAAKQLNADGHHAAAIVTAQSACDAPSTPLWCHSERRYIRHNVD
jgi:hypothetical protein